MTHVRGHKRKVGNRKTNVKAHNRRNKQTRLPPLKTTAWVTFGSSTPIKVGMKVMLRDDVLQRHAATVPARFGFTPEQFEWRKTLKSLEGKTGKIQRTFPDSKHVNVQFGKTLIGIDKTELKRGISI